MIVFLLLVIIAILLFGAGAILGVAAWIAAIIAGVVAFLYLLGIWITLDTATRVLAVVSPVLLLISFGFIYVIIRVLPRILSDAVETLRLKNRANSPARKRAAEVWRSFDLRMIDRFSRSALRAAHEARNKGNVRRMKAIYDIECARIKDRMR